jgi:hypothetical protein
MSAEEELQKFREWCRENSRAVTHYSKALYRKPFRLVVQENPNAHAFTLTVEAKDGHS